MTVELGAFWRPTRGSFGWILIADDFNSNSPKWGEARLQKTGMLVSEIVVKNDLIVLNRRHEFTLRRGAVGSIIDITIAAPHLASKIGGWLVLDHWCIAFSLHERSQLVNTGRSDRGKSSSWDTRRLNKN